MTATKHSGAAEIERLQRELQEKDRLLQEALARETRYRRVMESNMVGVLFWNTEGQVTDANEKVLELTGYTRDDLREGRINWANMTPPEYAEVEAVAHRELAAKGVCTPFRKEYIRKDGTRVPILIGGAMLEGTPEEGVCFLLDMTEHDKVVRQLEVNQRLFQAFADNTLTVAFIKDLQGRRLYVNSQYREIFGGDTELIGKSDLEMYGPERAELLRRDDEEVLRSKTAQQFLFSLPTREGGERTWLSYKFPLELEPGRMVIGGVAIDITELKQAQEQLRISNEQLERRVAERTEELERVNRHLKRSETRLRKWLEQSVVPIQVVSPEGWTVQVNPAWEKVWGVKFEEMGDLNLLTDAQVEEQGIGNYIRRALSGEVAYVPEVPFVPENGIYAGQARWCSGVIYPIKNDATGEVEEIVIIHDDVTDRRAAEEKLREEERVMRKLLDLQEQERKLIAYEIHDGLVQDLAAAQMNLDAFLQTRPEHQTPSLQTSVTLMRKAIDEARRLINGLRPLVLDERGIVTSIEYLLAEEEARGGPAIQFFHRVAFDRLPPLLEGTLFRIVQECIINAKRHSGTKEIEVWLQQEDNTLKLMVRDYGCGFLLDQVPKDRFGLEGIRRRAQIFGGKSQIESHLDEGTTVRIEIPLEPTAS